MSVFSTLPVSRDHKFAYNIVISDSFSDLSAMAREAEMEGRRLCIVTDSNVEKLYLDEVKKCLEPLCSRILVHVLPAGEKNKNLDHIRDIYKTLMDGSLDRGDFLAALGGGVVGDMTGFAAATYLRGIKFIQIPTTLLSQVDSSIGGKTGVDFDQYKNMVGAFHMPSLVYINTNTLRTLDNIQFASGMGEVLKHGIIRDANYYEYLLDHMSEIEDREPRVLSKVVEGSCIIKRAVVQRDPLEKGERAVLNFGHTIGHAIEKSKNFTLTHGSCVALGSVAAAYISWQRGLIDEETFTEIRDMMVGFGLPISFDSVPSKTILTAVKHDKKMSAGHIRFILLHALGDAYIDTTVTEEEMLKAIDYLNADVSDSEGD